MVWGSYADIAGPMTVQGTGKIPTEGLYDTVYDWDMQIEMGDGVKMTFKPVAFTRAILAGKPIEIYGDGRMRRDYTYVDDVIEGITRLLWKPASPDPEWSGAKPDPASSSAPYRLYNIGNRSTIEVLRLIEVLEDCLGKKALRSFSPALGCEVSAAVADTSDLERDTGYEPTTPLETGVRKFVEWYRDYYKA